MAFFSFGLRKARPYFVTAWAIGLGLFVVLMPARAQDRLALEPTVKLRDLSEVRVLAPGTQQSVFHGDTVRVRGVVTVGTGDFDMSRLFIYIQTEDAGIRVVSDTIERVVAGEDVEVAGRVGFDAGSLVLEAYSVDVIGESEMPAYVSLPERREEFEYYEGQRVRVEGEIVARGMVQAGSYVTLLRENGDTINLFAFVGMGAAPNFEAFKQRDRIQVVGVLNQFTRSQSYTSGYQIIPTAGGLSKTDLNPDTYRALARGGIVLLLLFLGAAIALAVRLRQRTRTLERHREMLTGLVNDQNNLICRITPSGKLSFVNEPMIKLWGIPEERLVTMQFVALFDDEQALALQPTLTNVWETGDPEKQELKFQTDSREEWIDWSFRLIPAEGERQAEVQAVGHLITSRYEYERALVDAKRRADEANRLKSAVLKNLSHEVRTPLMSILGFNELLADELTGEHKTYAQHALDSGSRLMETITSLLQFAQLEGGRLDVMLGPTDIGEAIRETINVLRPQAKRKDLYLTYQSFSVTAPTVVTADDEAVRRVLFNLIGNAVKFTRQGGVGITLSQEGPFVFVRIEDTGIGMDQSFLRRLYDGFTQESEGIGRTYEGNGLGLAISKRLLDLMGAEIMATSRKGIGTVFTIRFALHAYEEGTDAGGDSAPAGETLPETPQSTEEDGV
ncbi:MAG: HAMP domain-containing sensor histidine kinase, partial [Bacteroidota bacterium]